MSAAQLSPRYRAAEGVFIGALRPRRSPREDFDNAAYRRRLVEERVGRRTRARQAP